MRAVAQTGRLPDRPQAILTVHGRAVARPVRFQRSVRMVIASMRVVLPLPPGINNQYATIGNRRVLSKEAARFKAAVRRLLRGSPSAAPYSDPELEALKTGYLGLYLEFYFTTPLRRDLDGGLKIAQDAICEALGLDDRRVVDIHLVKRIDPLRPRLEAELEAIATWTFDQEYVYLAPSAPADSAER